ncbi:MAG: KUP/HAK/KT family potassium transporter, partial [Rhodanobacteraceae bacterium]
RDAKTVAEVVQDLQRKQVARIPGSAIFLTLRLQQTPPSLTHHIECNHALQEQVVLLTVLSEDVPRTTREERMEFSDLEDGFFRLVLHYGYLQQPNIPSELATCKDKGLEIDLKAATYYIEHPAPVGEHGRRRDGMAAWRGRLLGYMIRNSRHATASYQIPDGQVIDMGLRVRI